MIGWYTYLLLLFGLSWAFIGLFRWYAIDKGIVDVPNERSSHMLTTPRGGGVVFFMGWSILLGFLHYYKIISMEYALLFLPALLTGLIGFCDDYKAVPASVRFGFQCFAAFISLFLANEGGEILQSFVSHLIFIPLPLCFLFLAFIFVWIINLFNFMDGSDGFAATEAIFVFALGGFMLFEVNAYEFGVLAWSLVALLAGFLSWNWPGAKIFMGDSGSYFLGTLLAIYMLMGYKLFNMSILIWLILSGLFWFDATVTLIRRMIAKEKWYKPHRSHAYQRLIISGWSHQQVLLSAIAVNCVLSGLALLAFFEPSLLYFSCMTSLLFLSCLYIAVEIVKPMFKEWHDA